MKLYAESSAVLAWLLGEAAGARTSELLGGADLVLASDLTLVECDRVLIRAIALGELAEGEAAERSAYLRAAAARWYVLRIGPDIVERARHPLPGEPIRTLDALHLACALAARSSMAGVQLLSLDARIRRAARRIGFVVEPPDPVPA